MSINNALSPFPYLMGQLNNISPLTYRDGATYLKVLEKLIAYVQETQTPEIQALLEKYYADFQEGIANAENTITQTKNEWIDEVVLTKNEWQTFFDNFMEFVVERLEALNDESVANLINTNDSQTRPALNNAVSEQHEILGNSNRIELGEKSLALLPKSYNLGTGGTVVSLGYEALGKVTGAKKTIAIGADAMSQSILNRDNVAIGESALRNVQSSSADYSQTDRSGTRNVAIGGNAGHFVNKGYGHTIIGRNAGHCIVGGTGLVAIGSNANGGYAPIGLSGVIENWAPWGNVGQTVRTVAVGTSAAAVNLAPNITAIGGEALANNKKSDNNVALGSRALRLLDSNTGTLGGLKVVLSIAGTYHQSGNTLTITANAHTLVAGDTVQFRLLTGDSQTFGSDQVMAQVVQAITADQFTVFNPSSRDASGNAQLYGKETGAQQPQNGANVGVGVNAAHNMLTGVNNVVIGDAVAGASTVITQSTVVGASAVKSALSLYNVTVIGANAGVNIDDNPRDVTALGASALRNNIDGTPYTVSHNNVTALGFDSRVSGGNQLQLGDTFTSSYSYGAVQNRSDERDKTEIKDTVLGLDFINAVRPVDYKYKYRETGVTGSRFHHGVIAQEIESVIHNSGIDFGGFQDHKIGGGDDVLSIGYTEFIAPLIKAVQELSSEVTELKKQLGA